MSHKKGCDCGFCKAASPASDNKGAEKGPWELSMGDMSGHHWKLKLGDEWSIMECSTPVFAKRILSDLNSLQALKASLSASERFRKEDAMSHINEANELRASLQAARERIKELEHERFSLLDKAQNMEALKALSEKENERLRADKAELHKTINLTNQQFDEVYNDRERLKQGIEELKKNCQQDISENESKLVKDIEPKTEGFYNGCATTNRIILQELIELLPSPEQPETEAPVKEEGKK